MAEPSLRRQLGFAAAAAVVSGNMLGSGIFFTPSELAAVAQHSWQVYFIWGLCGIITLCGAVTLAEMSSRIPESGASFHIIRKAFGPFWGFLKIWVEMFVAGPGSVAGIAILLGKFLSKFSGFDFPVLIGIAAVCFFTIINLMGVRWGGWTQIVLTAIKILALLALVCGSLLFSVRQESPGVEILVANGVWEFLRFVGLGVAAVLFTYDGWGDVTHAAGEVANPQRNLRSGLITGVIAITCLYLFVNYAYLRVVPLNEMRAEPTLVASILAVKTFGSAGAFFLNALILISIFGALGGLVMTLPRLFFGAATQYKQHLFFRGLSVVSKKTAVPSGSILFCAILSVIALLTFQSFSRLANFLVVSLQFVNMLMVASIFRLRQKNGTRSPGYPVVPLIYVSVMSIFLLSAIYYNPKDTLIGIALTLTCVPAYVWMKKGKI